VSKEKNKKREKDNNSKLLLKSEEINISAQEDVTNKNRYKRKYPSAKSLPNSHQYNWMILYEHLFVYLF